jgi:hypothetical protein
MISSFSLKLFVIFFVATTAASGAVITNNKLPSACQETLTINYTTGCSIDLTIAIDMSLSMKSISNIAILSDSILTNFLPMFNFNETYTAGITFGTSTEASQYFNNYGDICEYIHSAQQTAIQLGLTPANLSSVFQTYDINLLRSGRNYKKVLILLTAINDEKEILSAKEYANNIRSYGVYIIIGALGTNPNSDISQLGDLTFYSPDFTVPSGNITSDVCQFGGYTVFPSDSPTANPTGSPSDPRSNAIGTECSTNVSNAWLDIALVIDVSSAMNTEDLQQLAISTLAYLSEFNIGSVGDHTTRVSIITYSTDVTIRYNLNDQMSQSAIIQQLRKLTSYSNPNDDGVNVQGALQTAYKHLQDQGSKRVPIILLTAAAYQEKGFAGALHTSKIIKDNGITIFTINFGASDGVLNENLELLASPGYAYISTTSQVYSSIAYGLTQVNCFCPEDSLQFRVYDSEGKNYTTYADCIWGSPNAGSPSIISIFGCDPGVMASITSKEKLDFVTDNILPHELLGKTEFLVGGHKSSNSQWMWYGYSGDEYPIGYFPTINYSEFPNGQYSYFKKGVGFTFNFFSTDNTPRSYLCESKACDADNICDQTLAKFAKKFNLKNL